MALVDTSVTYAGEHAGKYISASLLEANTISAGGITVMPNVKFKSVIGRIDTGSLVKGASCDFTASGDVTLKERIIAPKRLQVNTTLCKDNFADNWEVMQMGFSAHESAPKTFTDYLIGYMADKVAASTEVSIWRGTSGDDDYAGLTTQIALDAALPQAQELAGATVNSSNVISELGSIVDAIPSSLYTKEDLYIYVSQNIARAYIRQLGGYGANGLGAQGFNNQGTMWYNNGSLSFDGVKIFVANGLADNTAVATTKSNLFFGTGLLSDHNLIQVIDTAATLGDQNIRFVMRYTAGVQYGVVEDIVTYGITNAAND
jgi:hypothetical protein